MTSVMIIHLTKAPTRLSIVGVMTFTFFSSAWLAVSPLSACGYPALSMLAKYALERASDVLCAACHPLESTI
jgi:hypothetical protein